MRIFRDKEMSDQPQYPQMYPHTKTMHFLNIKHIGGFAWEGDLEHRTVMISNEQRLQEI